MNHAREYRTIDRTTKRSRTSKAIQRIRTIRSVHEQAKGFGRGAERQTAGCSPSDASDAFLKSTFAPKLAQSELVRQCPDKAKMEGDFYSSLSNLCQLRGLFMTETRQLGFPYNIALAMQNLQQELKANDAEAQDIRLVQHEDEVFFARQERFDTGMTLYYIPVEPLFFMLHDKMRKQASKLFLSVFAYLYQVAHIPYHRHEGNYLFYTYDMLNDWKMQDDEDDLEFTSAYSRMEFVGDAIEIKIRHPENLNQFEKRLQTFRAIDRFDEDCLKLANKAFELFGQYPNTRIYHKCGEVLYSDDEHDEGMQIALDSYVSFYGSACGELSDLLIETVNADLQEFSSIDEPIIYLPLDGRDIKDNNFDFETKLFALLEDLSTLLNNYKD